MDLIIDLLADLQKSLVDVAEQNVDVILPGFTHLQVAQPVSFAHHLLAYVEMFSRDAERMVDVRRRTNRLPLGSAALAGTTYPLDRERVARTLGMVDEAGNPQVCQNSLDGVSDRDFAIEFTAAASLCMVHISRFSEELILWMSQNFGFARIASAKAALATQELRLKYTRVVAPDSGVISARSATVGSVVAAGTELFRMIRQGRLEWRAEVTAADLPRIKSGASAVVKAANGAELTGKVRMVAPTIDPQSRYALVYVDLPAPKGAEANAFKAGMFASGRFELGASDAMTVPQQAVAVRDGFSYVFRLNPDKRVSRIKVQTGRRLSDRIEILGGIDSGTQVVVSGAGFLNDGDLVNNVAAPAVPQAAAPAQAAAKAPKAK
eukprot:gene40522-50123_t